MATFTSLGSGLGGGARIVLGVTSVNSFIEKNSDDDSSGFRTGSGYDDMNFVTDDTSSGYGNFNFYTKTINRLKISNNGGVTMPALPTSAGSGGLYICIDTNGVLYKAASCP